MIFMATKYRRITLQRYAAEHHWKNLVEILINREFCSDYAHRNDKKFNGTCDWNFVYTS